MLKLITVGHYSRLEDFKTWPTYKYKVLKLITLGNFSRLDGVTRLGFQELTVLEIQTVEIDNVWRNVERTLANHYPPEKNP